ncbi:MAG: hypothetical protein PHS41_12665, partial [Victivallaceae bacterium]|nr:hypothetical protein [Victivallaceae bacterium]
FRVDRERNEMVVLSGATRRVTPEKTPFQAFSEAPEDAARLLSSAVKKTVLQKVPSMDSEWIGKGMKWWF